MSRAINTITAATAVDGATNLNIDSGTLFINTTTNKVGISTTSPTELLEVGNESTSNNYIKVSAANNTASGIKFRSDSSLTIGYDIGYEGSGNHFFFNNDVGGTVTERMRIDGNGNVGIGTGGVAPASKLDVYGVGNFQALEIGKSGRTGNRDCLIDLVGDDTYSDYGFRIIRNSTGSNTSTVLTHRGTGELFFRTEEAGPILFQTANTERLRIDGANGTLTSQPTYDNTAAGSAVVVTSAGLIRRTSSSLKYKKDIENLDSSIVDNAIDRLRPVWYRTKNPEGDDKSTWSHVGLIAEEVNSVEPRLVRYRTVEVSTNENGERIETQLENPVPEDVDYARLSVILLSEVKAQRVKIASLEARLEALEAA